MFIGGGVVGGGMEIARCEVRVGHLFRYVDGVCAMVCTCPFDLP